MRRLLVLASILALVVTPAAHAESMSASDLLEKLALAPESNSDTYQRTLFKHWIDQDKDKCDTREEVLIQESIKPAKTGSGCKVLAGKWVSAYDNKSFTSATGLDIDHMVPLKEAWESGAFAWTSAQRQAFANDLGFKGSLIAVSASTNRSKGDKDPSTWLPKNAKYTCTYIVTWLQVKYRWSLTVDDKEKTAISKKLESCPASKVFTVPKQMITSPVVPEPSNEPPPAASSSVPETDAGLDPKFSSCSAAKEAGFGPYVKNVDPEYDWYRDGDSDGIVCE